MGRWKPKTVFGKIVKTAVIGGGTVLGLAGGLGAAKGIIKGTGALTGIGKGIGGLRNFSTTLKDSAANLVTGTTKAERAQINAVKERTRAEQDKLDQVQRLIRAGATPDEARSTVGLTVTELTEIEGKPMKSSAMFDLGNPVIKWGLIAVAGYFGLKFLKIIK